MTADRFTLHPDNPQPRLISQCVDRLRRDAVIAYPTDSSYALGCLMDSKKGVDRIASIRRIDKKHNFTLVSSDLATLSRYVRMDNWQFRLIKNATPGPFTFILKANAEAPRRMQNDKRKTIGIRIPEHPVTHALLDALGEPLLSSTLILPDQEWPLSEADDVEDAISHQLDIILDAGATTREPTTVIDLSGDAPEILRQGLGDFSPFIG